MRVFGYSEWVWRHWHRLLGIAAMEQMVTHPKLGASWEGFALEQIIRLSGADEQEVFFWGVYNQAELDLLVFRKGWRMGYEVKYSDAPRVTTSQTQALELLGLESLKVVIPGDADYPLADKIRVAGLNRIVADGIPD